MTADALFFLSLSVGIFAIADIMLSNVQKDRISASVVRIWYSLDSWKRFVGREHSKRWKWWFKAAILVGLVVGFLFEVLIYFSLSRYTAWPIPDTGYVSILATVTIFILTAPPALYLLLLSRSISDLGFRAFVILFAILLIVVVLNFLVALVYRVVGGQPPDASLFALGSMVSTFPVAGLLNIVLLIYLPLAIARGALFGVEFVVRRLAEYPKGPMLAISGISTALIGIIKIFG